MKGIIYIATNVFNGKSYIGQTRTTLQRRMSQHLRDAVTDGVNHFHLALMQYGKEAFEWSILDEFEGTKEEVIHALNVAEEYHILKRKTMLDEYGYNATKGGYSSDVFAEEIRKRALANYGGKSVLQYDLDGGFVREFDSIAAVKREYGTEQHKGKYFIGRTWKGFQWREKTNNLYPRKIAAYVAPTSKRSVVVYSQSGEFYKEYDSQKKCVEDLGKSYKVRGAIGNVSIRSYQKDTYFVFRKPLGEYPDRICVEVVNPKEKPVRIDQRRRVRQYDRSGVFMREFDSIREAQRLTGASEKSIRRQILLSQPIPIYPQIRFLWRLAEGETSERIETQAKRVKQECRPTKEHRIVQYDIEGNIMKIWKNMYQAALQTGESHTLIRKQCMGIPTKKKTPSVWRYYKDHSDAV